MRQTTHRSSCFGHFGSFVGFAVTLVVGASAQAQGRPPAQVPGWLEDRERAEGPGIRVGDLELHPGIGSEIGYDSNVFYSDGDRNPVQGSPILRVTPHLLVSTLGEERRGEGEKRGVPPVVAFRGGGSASLIYFFETEARSNVEGQLNMKLSILPERPFTFNLHENFGRTIRPFTERGAAGENYARSQNEAGANVEFGTAGDIFKGTLGYTFGLDHFEGTTFRYASSYSHRGEAGVYWKFFPNTALLYDGRVEASTYPNSEDAIVLLSDSVRVRSRVGINGAITQRLSLLGMVGYSGGFYDRGEEFDGVVGQAEARWNFTPSSRIALGYDREYFRSILGNFYRRDRGYLNLALLLGRVFLIGGEASLNWYDFGATLDQAGNPLDADGTGERDDLRLRGSLFAEYRVTDWLAFNGTVAYTRNMTDFEFIRAADMFRVPDPARYQKFEAWFGVRVFY